MTTLIDREEQTFTDRPVHDPKVDTLRTRNRFLIIALAIVTAAFVALGTWTLVDRSGSSDVAPTAEIQQLLDDYEAAWNDYDGAAFLALVTDGYGFEISGTTTGAATQALYIDNMGSTSWHVTQVGDAISAGDGPYYVALVDNLTAVDYPVDGVDGVSIVTVVDDGGTLKVDHHVFIGDL